MEGRALSLPNVGGGNATRRSVAMPVIPVGPETATPTSRVLQYESSDAETHIAKAATAYLKDLGKVPLGIVKSRKSSLQRNKSASRGSKPYVQPAPPEWPQPPVRILIQGEQDRTERPSSSAPAALAGGAPPPPPPPHSHTKTQDDSTPEARDARDRSESTGR